VDKTKRLEELKKQLSLSQAVYQQAGNDIVRLTGAIQELQYWIERENKNDGE